MNSNSPAAKIRQDLKAELDATSRQISVVSSRSGSVDITIKVPGFSHETVEAVGRRHESIRRCERTHDILEGGNIFVSTSWDWRLVRDAAAPIATWIEGLKVQAGHCPVPGCSDLALTVERTSELTSHLWNGRHLGDGSAKHVASLIAKQLLEVSRDFDPDAPTDPAPEAEEVEEVEAPAETMPEAMLRRSKELLGRVANAETDASAAARITEDHVTCPGCGEPVGMYSAEDGKIVCSGPACGAITEVDGEPTGPWGDEECDGKDLAPESIAPAANERPWEASAAPSQPDRVTVGLLTYTPPRAELFAGADQGTSHVPEDRARQRREDFDADVAHLAETAGQFLTGAQLDRYVAAWSSYLAALGRCVSTMVAGRSNFPVRRAQKASASADRRLEELLELKKRLIRSAKRERKGAEVEVAGGPVAILRQDVEATTGRLAMMKEANKIVRSKPRNVRTDGKIERLVAAGVGPTVAESLFVQDFARRLGYPGFELTSARTDIKRKEERILELERRDEQSARDDEINVFDGVTVTLCYADNKIRIQHDEIPAKEFRQTLNTSGWNFSRRESAWQRQLTENAIWSAETLLGVKIEKGERA